MVELKQPFVRGRETALIEMPISWSLDDYPHYNEVRREVFGATLPTSTAVAVAGLILTAALIEIDAVAFIPKAEG